MYVIEDVTNRYSADHITDLGSMNKRPDRRFRVNEVYIMNGLENSKTEATQITMLNGFSEKPLTIKPTLRPRIGSGAAMESRRKRRGPGLGSYAPNYMTRSTLSSMSDDVKSLQRQIDSRAKVPAWAESYIYTAGDRVNTVEEYMSHRQNLAGASNLGDYTGPSLDFSASSDFPYFETNPNKEMKTLLALGTGLAVLTILVVPISMLLKRGFEMTESFFDAASGWQRLQRAGADRKLSENRMKNEA